MITDINQLDFSKQYSYADYLAWWFDERVELVKGYIRKMSPAPTKRHQTIGLKLLGALIPYFKNKKCQIFYAPFDVRLTRTIDDKDAITVVQPDIMIVCDPDMLDERGCNGPPDMIIEILSESNRKHDLVTKYNLYEEAGVSEYWVVFPADDMIEVYLLENGKYKLDKRYIEDEIINVKTIEGLQINLTDIFY
ncbi:MAG: Uma2 family endonuclease [Bacteroidetes bacterium]|nr:MAG: Uma2 family endonuclease [Bacteroidota bacterium]